ncbi:MAG: aminopeptidase P family protein [Firmicutes bacterium]|jgi:Xaa-Pro aminopeptidase|uniref:Aminopeptidase P family protein n=1 Tax=Sulfobacillus benefaciens TaxID=453960 RepID=A0A2T2XBT7_9FIRM|nr:aminopeptidase P family protein [Bacillota bacterium]MCL5014772.1 aminopeptidase P family protein [Bacillota bacterium]PSR31906.1 MAG: hypothetical protein C7B43_01410 [Sulfobacillus benefaciens]
MSRIDAVWENCGPGIDAFMVCSRQNRYYLSAFTGSAGCLLIDGAHRFLITDSRYTEQARAEATLFEVVESRRVWDKAAELARSQGWKRIGFEAEHVTVHDYLRLLAQYRDLEWVPLTGIVERERRIKDDVERAHLQRAAQIADRALSGVLDHLHPGVSEREFQLALDHAMEEEGAEGVSFPTIVASGPRGSLPHAKPTERRFEDDDWVTIDFGAVYQGYHSDETVTIPLTNRARSGKLQIIYDIVLQAQKAGIKALRAGVFASQVDEIVRDVIIEAGFGEYFGHGTGHGVGLDVHEDPLLGPNPPNDVKLDEGMVVTIEPGIYLPQVGGVRLEDMLLVTAEGSTRLSAWNKE